MAPTNPARLLHRNLQLLRQAHGDRVHVRDAVAKAFALNPKEDVQLRTALVAFDRLFQSVEVAVKRLPAAYHATFLRHFPQIRKLLVNVHFDNPAAQSLNFITDVALENLDSAALRIGEELEEIEVSDAEIMELAGAVEELMTWLESTSLDSTIRILATDLLETLRHALVEYRIRGIEGLQQAVEESVGKLARYHCSGAGDQSAEPLQKLWTLVRRFDAVASRALTYGPCLPEALQRLLGAGS